MHLEIGLRLGLLALIVLIGGGAILFFRALLLKQDPGPPSEGFTLAELKAMRDRGQLTAAEYAAAHAALVAKLKAAAKEETPAERRPEKA